MLRDEPSRWDLSSDFFSPTDTKPCEHARISFRCPQSYVVPPLSVIDGMIAMKRPVVEDAEPKPVIADRKIGNVKCFVSAGREC